MEDIKDQLLECLNAVKQNAKNMTATMRALLVKRMNSVLAVLSPVRPLEFNRRLCSNRTSSQQKKSTTATKPKIRSSTAKKVMRISRSTSILCLSFILFLRVYCQWHCMT